MNTRSKDLPASSPEGSQVPLDWHRNKGKVLVVDDNDSTRSLMSWLLKAYGWEVTLAAGGEEAFRMIQRNVPDVVVMDYEMPGLNGVELCQRIRGSASSVIQEVPIIILTSHTGEIEQIECLKAGANDFLTKPFSRIVLETRIQTQLRLGRLTAELRIQNEQLTQWRREQEANLATASATQKSLAPLVPPSLEGWLVEVACQPLLQVGGDVYGWKKLIDGRGVFWIAETNSHGAAAALFTTLATFLFSQACASGSSPSEILAWVNREFCNVFHCQPFLAACCVMIDSSGRASLCSAGHQPILLRRLNGEVESYGPHGAMLGIDQELVLDESATQLDAGECLLLFTDGIFKFQGMESRVLNHHAVCDALHHGERPGSVLPSLLSLLKASAEGRPPGDDMTSLALVRL